MRAMSRTAGRRRCVLALLITLSGLARAQDGGGDSAVGIEQEPRHKLVLNTPLLRAFDAVLQPGDTTLYHQHERDSVYVSIVGSDTQSQEPGKATETRAPNEPGKVWFRDNAKTPLVHKVSNIGKTAYRVIDIEAMAGASEREPLAPLPQAYQPVLENDRVRVSRLVLAPGGQTELRPMPRPRLLVVVRASRMLIDWKPNHTLFDPDPGDLHFMDRPGEQKISNNGDQTLELVQVELK